MSSYLLDTALASEILAGFGAGIANRMPAGRAAAQMRPAPGPKSPSAPMPRLGGVAQRFTVDGVTFSNNTHLVKRNISDNKKLDEKICEDQTFTSKSEDVKAG
jgi:hypothetical protein